MAKGKKKTKSARASRGARASAAGRAPARAQLMTAINCPRDVDAVAVAPLGCGPVAGAPAAATVSCPAGTALDPLTPLERAERARDVRKDAAEFERNRADLNPPSNHLRNGDESLSGPVPAPLPSPPASPPPAGTFNGTFFAAYSKGLPHNHLGEVEREAYCALLRALKSGVPGLPPPPPLGPPPPVDPTKSDFENVPLGCTGSNARKLEHPQAGLAFALEGADSHALHVPPPPDFRSNDEAAEMAELYWMALARDVPFALRG